MSVRATERVGATVPAKRLAVDRAAGEVRVGAHSLAVRLSALEMSLLAYLYENRGRLVSTDDIGAAVWGTIEVNGDAVPKYSATMVHRTISRVRAKLRDVPLDLYLGTARGLGYRLDEFPRAAGDFYANQHEESDEATTGPDTGRRRWPFFVGLLIGLAALIPVLAAVSLLGGSGSGAPEQTAQEGSGGTLSAFPPQVQAMIARLPVPAGLHLVVFDETDGRHCGFTSSGCYLPASREIRVASSELWDRQTVPHSPSWTWSVAYQTCKAHIHWQVQQAGMGNDLAPWQELPQGKAFASAQAAIYAAYPGAGLGIKDSGLLIENFANTCALWYLNPAMAQSIEPLKTFAQAWLP